MVGPVAHDVFISYSSKDKAAADAACNVLERNGVRVWIAPRDILPGVGWAESLINAISNARVMVLVYSSNANASAADRARGRASDQQGLTGGAVPRRGRRAERHA